MSKDKSNGERVVASHYWHASLRVTLSLLSVWALLSLGCGILFRDFLDARLPNVGGAPFGFWMAQQGAIVGFLILLVIYKVVMNRIDHQHGYDPEDQP